MSPSAPFLCHSILQAGFVQRLFPSLSKPGNVVLYPCEGLYMLPELHLSPWCLSALLGTPEDLQWGEWGQPHGVAEPWHAAASPLNQLIVCLGFQAGPQPGVAIPTASASLSNIYQAGLKCREGGN